MKILAKVVTLREAIISSLNLRHGLVWKSRAQEQTRVEGTEDATPHNTKGYVWVNKSIVYLINVCENTLQRRAYDSRSVYD